MSEAREILVTSRKLPTAGARLIGRTDPKQIIHVTVVLNRRSEISSTELQRHTLTRPHDRPKIDASQFAQQYGAGEDAVDAVKSLAAKYGLTIVKIDAPRRVVELSGTVSDLEQAFGTELHDSVIGTHTYRSRRGPLSLPSDAYPHIEAVLGLDNRPVAKPRLRPHSVGVGYYPQEVAALYSFPAGDGAGQTIALIELGGNLGQDDLTTYFRAAGLTRMPDVRSVNVGTHAPVLYGQDSESDGEVMLDIEVVGAIAPGATIVVYFADNTDQGFYEAVSQAIHDPATTAVSISWGSPEKGWSEQSMEAWNSLGQSATLLQVPIFVAAGDHGCADEVTTDAGYDGQRHVDFPGTCTDGVICCGGTRLQSDQGTITAETVWNDGDGWATGGGVSTYFPVPDWQKGLSAEDGSPLHMRGVPDIAAVADPRTGIKVRSNGADGVTGGTSAVAPQWAALTALLSQQLGRKVGFFLPVLYQKPSATHDIVKGNNSVFGIPGYSARAGWDACTGLGSPNGLQLLALLGGSTLPSTQPVPLGNPPVPPQGGSTSPPTSNPVPRLAAPFDPQAATRYGQFIVSAYSMYDADPKDTTPAPSADFPSSHQLVAWVLMQDFILGSTAPVFYGFIAKSIANPNAFVLAIRGTANGVEWWDDANSVVMTPFKVPNCGRIGTGFARIYDTLEVIECASGHPAAPAVTQSLRPAGSFSQQVSTLLRHHAIANARDTAVPPSATIEVTGHSLGAALATLYAMENARVDQVQSLMLCTFASPLVGDSTFVAAFNALGMTSWRIVNQPDIVPKLPPAILGFRHVDTLQPLNSAGKVKASLTCWHAMTTYLSLLDPTLQPDSACRVAATAPSVDPSVVTTLPSRISKTISDSVRGITVNLTINLGNESISV
jgi:kumamolisin